MTIDPNNKLLKREPMSTQKTLTRDERIAQIIDKKGAELNMSELREAAEKPKQFFVGEYESGDLLGLATFDTLDEAETHINECGAVSRHYFRVIDLDTDKSHFVYWTAKIER